MGLPFREGALPVLGRDGYPSLAIRSVYHLWYRFFPQAVGTTTGTRLGWYPMVYLIFCISIAITFNLLSSPLPMALIDHASGSLYSHDDGYLHMTRGPPENADLFPDKGENYVLARGGPGGRP